MLRSAIAESMGLGYDRDDLGSMRELLRVLQTGKVNTAFQAIELAIKCVIEDTRDRIAELSPLTSTVNLQDLPDELLSTIFAMASDCAWTSVKIYSTRQCCSTPLYLSHVSQRLRNVTLATPGLWVNISNIQHPDMTDAFIARSGNGLLNVGVIWPNCVRIPSWPSFAEDSQPYEQLTMSFIEKSSQLTKRWEAFTYITSSPLDDASSRFHDVLKSHRLGALPELRSVSITLSSTHEYWSEDAEDLAGMNFYVNWDAPKMGSLRMDGVLPLPSFALESSMKSLTGVEIHAPSSTGEGPNDTVELNDTLVFLSQLPKLEFLSLSLRVLNVTAEEPGFVQSKVSFPTLQILHVVVSANDDAEEFWRRFHAPNLVELDVRAKLWDEASLWWFVKLILPPKSYSKLRTLKLNFRFQNNVYHQILDNRKKLQHLTIGGFGDMSSCSEDGTGGRASWLTGNGPGPSALRTIRFENCHSFGSYLLKDNSAKLKKSLRQLEVVDCTWWNRADVAGLGLVKKDRLVWTDQDKFGELGVVGIKDYWSDSD